MNQQTSIILPSTSQASMQHKLNLSSNQQVSHIFDDNWKNELMMTVDRMQTEIKNLNKKANQDAEKDRKMKKLKKKTQA